MKHPPEVYRARAATAQKKADELHAGLREAANPAAAVRAAAAQESLALVWDAWAVAASEGDKFDTGMTRARNAGDYASYFNAQARRAAREQPPPLLRHVLSPELAGKIEWDLRFEHLHFGDGKVVPKDKVFGDGLSLRYKALQWLSLVRKGEYLLAQGEQRAHEDHYRPDRQLDTRPLRGSSRGERSYASELGPRFFELLGTMGPGGWLDVGTNLQATTDFLWSLPKEGRPRVTGIDLVPRNLERAQTWAGKTLGFWRGNVKDFKPDRRYSVVTDLYAACSYDPDLTQVLEAELNALEAGGHLILRVNVRASEVVTASGARLPLDQWLERHDGLEVTSEDPTHRGFEKVRTLFIKKKVDDIHLPQVRRLAQVDGCPPHRLFVEV